MRRDGNNVLNGATIEHRVCPRIPLQCSVLVSTDRLVAEGTILNLGVTGCAVRSQKVLKRGEHVELDLHLPDDKQALRVPVAKVRWADKGRYGVEFLKFAWEHEVRVGQLVTAYQQQIVDEQHLIEEEASEPGIRRSMRRFVDSIRTKIDSTKERIG